MSHGQAGSAVGVEMPDLRIVSMGDVLLHEDADERRIAALAQRLQAEGMLRNPPLVAEMPAGAAGEMAAESEGQSALGRAESSAGPRFVVLDGANRVSALRKLELPDLIVQVVDYEAVQLSTWYHLITGAPAERLLTALRELTCIRLERSEIETARQDLETGEILSYLVLPDGSVYSLRGGGDLTERTECLRRTVAVYKGRANIHRVQTDDMAALRRYYSEIAGLVVFPRYRSDDIMAMAQAGARLPSGITRHLVPLRALRTNTELSLLWSDTQRSEKNRWLAEWTRHKLQDREVRVYEERTVLYDE